MHGIGTRDKAVGDKECAGGASCGYGISGRMRALEAAKLRCPRSRTLGANGNVVVPASCEPTSRRSDSSAREPRSVSSLLAGAAKTFESRLEMPPGGKKTRVFGRERSSAMLLFPKWLAKHRVRP